MYQKSWWYDLQFLKYRIWLTEIGNYGSFFVLLPTPLKTFLKKWKKLLETWSFYTSVPKTTIIWGMVPEICCETDRIFFCHFGPIFALLSPNNPENQNFDKMKKHLEMSSFLHMCIIHDSHIMHGSWDMKCNRHNFLSFWAIFFPFYPHSSSKNQN